VGSIFEGQLPSWFYEFTVFHSGDAFWQWERLKHTVLELYDPLTKSCAVAFRMLLVTFTTLTE
jgi:hypothetical protein